MVQQHFALVGVLTALQNLMLGVRADGGPGRLDLDAATGRAAAERAGHGRASICRSGDRRDARRRRSPAPRDCAGARARRAHVILMSRQPCSRPRRPRPVRDAPPAGRRGPCVWLRGLTHKLDEVRALRRDVVTVLRGGPPRVHEEPGPAAVGGRRDPTASRATSWAARSARIPPRGRGPRPHGEVRLRRLGARAGA